MKKNLLIGLLIFFVLSNTSFACGCKDSNSLVTCKNQKACQTVFSFLAIDFSFLSPRATAADVHICAPNNCCMPQCCAPSCPPACPQCCPCVPQNCVPTCPQCCPCAPQCPACQKRSMKSSDDKKDEIIPVSDKQITPLSGNEIIPVGYKQIKNQSCTDIKSKTSFFRIDLFRIFKVQIL